VEPHGPQEPNPGLERTRHQLRASGAKDQSANPLRSGLHTRGYLLREWVVMPNHVHAIVWPMPNHLLSDILKTWKQFTSRRAKKLLGMGEEPFWQPESYEHWIRNDDERARIALYIRNNPVTARLCARPEDWRWSSAGESLPAP
jgi:putative transposase